jgi:hypothetical protein
MGCLGGWLWYNKRMNSPKTNIQSKSILARLLADENLDVVHDNKAQTAAFDLKNRRLILPCWKDMGNSLYDMLVGHEVSHALNTPSGDGWLDSIRDISTRYGVDHGIVQSYVNIVEDARIERMIKLKFPGLRRDFNSAYVELLRRDLFGIAGQDIDMLCFMDRFNLFFKVGIHAGIDIPFSAAEQMFVDAGAVTKTWEDVLGLVESILDSLPMAEEPETDDQQQEEAGAGGDSDEDQENDDQSQGGGSSEGEDEGDDGQESGNSPAPSDKGEDDSEDDSIGSKNGAPDFGRMADAPVTADVIERLSEELGDTDQRYISKEITLPTVNLEHTIMPYNDVYSLLNQDNAVGSHQWDLLAGETEDFIAKSRPTVNVLAKQFEMKKSADAHKRSMIAKTGSLDTVKMMGYRWNEDIFRKATVVPNGKNHGLIMFLDWSGSMSGVIQDTMDQMIQLVLFCKKVSIPFEVYAFTSGSKDRLNDRLCPNPVSNWDNAENTGYPVMADFTLLNLFSNKMNRNQLNYAIKCSRYMAKANGHHGSSMLCPRSLYLSSTPLNQTIVAAMQIVPEFRKKNNLQVVNSVFMTDGFSDKSAINGKDYIRTKGDRIGTRICDGGPGVTQALLKLLKKKTDTNSIGMYLETWTNTRFQYGAGKYFNYDSKRITDANETWRNENYAIATETFGYTEQFLIRADRKVENAGLESLGQGATRAKLKGAFFKSLKNKMTSRVVLNRFIDIIA